MEQATYSETTGLVARQAGVLEETVRLYADMGLVDCLRLSTGVRLFKPGAAAEINEIRRQRLARRGRRRGAAAA